ncbi:hypothetical protein HK100_006293 [Physocladia obscura]|uniref:SPRY-domain-containing protein n=1 Tax=Physocladia obscura TaxID=109957 RepID=A0AAD5T750_9FUNG|nr:hypothetical protein HK100_006293 [Physocladia obscura]
MSTIYSTNYEYYAILVVVVIVLVICLRICRASAAQRRRDQQTSLVAANTTYVPVSTVTNGALYSNSTFTGYGSYSNNGNTLASGIEPLPIYAPPAGQPTSPIAAFPRPPDIPASTITTAAGATPSVTSPANLYPADSSVQPTLPPDSSALPPPYQPLADPSDSVEKMHGGRIVNNVWMDTASDSDGYNEENDDNDNDNDNERQSDGGNSIEDSDDNDSESDENENSSNNNTNNTNNIAATATRNSIVALTTASVPTPESASLVLAPYIRRQLLLGHQPPPPAQYSLRSQALSPSHLHSHLHAHSLSEQRFLPKDAFLFPPPVATAAISQAHHHPLTQSLSHSHSYSLARVPVTRIARTYPPLQSAAAAKASAIPSFVPVDRRNFTKTAVVPPPISYSKNIPVASSSSSVNNISSQLSSSFEERVAEIADMMPSQFVFDHNVRNHNNNMISLSAHPHRQHNYHANGRNNHGYNFNRRAELTRATYIGPGEADTDAAAVRANRPIPFFNTGLSIFYFEVCVVSRGRDGWMGVGVSGPKVNLNRLPGWDSVSYGYHGDDGNIFECSGHGKPYGPTYTTGDYIGCILNNRDATISFTKNGLYLGVAFRNVPFSRPGSSGVISASALTALYPTVGFRTPGECMDINFGTNSFDNEFQFDIDSYLADQNSRMWERVMTMDNLLPTEMGQYEKMCMPDEKQQQQQQQKDQMQQRHYGTGRRINSTANIMHSLILGYLEYEGYHDTASSILSLNLKNNILQNTMMDLDEAMTDSNLKKARKKIHSLISDGKIEDAISIINIRFPDLLQTNRHVFFALKCRQFIETVTLSITDPKVKRSTAIEEEKREDEVLVANAMGESAFWDDQLISLGRDIVQIFSNDAAVNSLVKDTLTETFAVLAYSITEEMLLSHQKQQQQQQQQQQQKKQQKHDHQQHKQEHQKTHRDEKASPTHFKRSFSTITSSSSTRTLDSFKSALTSPSFDNKIIKIDSKNNYSSSSNSNIYSNGGNNRTNFMKWTSSLSDADEEEGEDDNEDEEKQEAATEKGFNSNDPPQSVLDQFDRNILKDIAVLVDKCIMEHTGHGSESVLERCLTQAVVVSQATGENGGFFIGGNGGLDLIEDID